MSPKQLSARAKLVAEINQLVKDYGIRAPFNFTYREVNPGHFLGQVSLLDQLIESKVATTSAKTAREEAAKEALLQIGSIRSKLDEKMRSKGIRDYSSQGSDSSLNLNRSSGSGSGSGASASTITSTSLVSSSSSSLGSGADAGFAGSGAVGSGSVGSGFIGSGSAGSGSAGSGFAGSGFAGSDPAGSGSSPTGFAGSSSSSGSGPADPAGSGSFGYSGFAGSSSGSGSGSGPGPNTGPSAGFNTGSNTDSNTGPDTPSQKSTPDPSQKPAPRKVTPGPSQAPVSHGVKTRSAVKKPSPPTKRLQAPPNVIGSKPSAPKPPAPKSSPTKVVPTKVAPLKVSPPKVSAPKQSGPVNLNSTKIISDNQQVQPMDIVENEIDPEEIHAVEKAKRILTEYLKFQSEPTNLQKPAVDLLREFAEAMPCQEPMYQVSEDLTPHPRYLSPCYSCVVTMENFTVCTEDSMPTCSLAKEQCASLALLILARTLCPPDVYKSLIGTMENEASYRRYTLTNGERLLLNGAGRYDMSVLHEALVKLGWSIGEMTYMERDGLYVCHLDIDRNPAPSMRSSSKIWAATKSESADVAARDLLDQMESGNLIVVSR
ncbi:hypothetical protein CLU79DRAFT_766277 [Phycomyces nitens]|nr:hypothetical protein CLU79DRAFT_766277 [Phycomyces nitens]